MSMEVTLSVTVNTWSDCCTFLVKVLTRFWVGVSGVSYQLAGATKTYTKNSLSTKTNTFPDMKKQLTPARFVTMEP